VTGRLPPLNDPSFVGKLQNAVDTLQQQKQTRNAPVKLVEYAVADLPDPANWKSCLIVVTDASVGYTPAYSDGTDWRSVIDGNIIS